MSEHEHKAVRFEIGYIVMVGFPPPGQIAARDTETCSCGAERERYEGGAWSPWRVPGELVSRAREGDRSALEKRALGGW